VLLVLGCRAPNPAFLASPDAEAAPVTPAVDAAATTPIDAPPSRPDAPRLEVARLDVVRLEAPSAERPAPDAAPPGLARGLIGYWRLDDGAGSTKAVDSSGRGNDGLLQNMDAQTAWVAGKFKGALRFNGMKQWVRIAASASINGIAMTKAVTVAAWINHAAGGPVNQGVVSRQYKATENDHFGLFADISQVLASANTQDDHADNVAADPAPIGKWMHLAMTADATALRFYVDGTLAIARVPVASNFVTDTTPVAIGDNNDRPEVDRDQFYVGLIDEVVLYDRVLSASEIRSLAAGETPLP